MENQQPVYVDREPQKRNWVALVCVGLNAIVCVTLIVLISQMGAIKLAIQGINTVMGSPDNQFIAIEKDGVVRRVDFVGTLKTDKELTEAEKEMVCK